MGDAPDIKPASTVVLLRDSDHAGCMVSSRSTSGSALQVSLVSICAFSVGKQCARS